MIIENCIDLVLPLIFFYTIKNFLNANTMSYHFVAKNQKIVDAAVNRNKARRANQGALRSLLGKINRFAQKHKLISKLGAAASSSGLLPKSASDPVRKGTAFASSLGYGRRYKGRGVRLAGAGVRLAGAGVSQAGGRKVRRRRKR